MTNFDFNTLQERNDVVMDVNDLTIGTMFTCDSTIPPVPKKGRKKHESYDLITNKGCIKVKWDAHLHGMLLEIITDKCLAYKVSENAKGKKVFIPMVNPTV